MARASPSGERELPWQPARARLHESQKLAAAIGALLLGHQKRHQPADPLIATSGVNQLRSISRDEKGSPGHPRPALRARRASRP